MPIFSTDLINNRFLINSLVFDMRNTAKSEIEKYLKSVNIKT